MSQGGERREERSGGFCKHSAPTLQRSMPAQGWKNSSRSGSPTRLVVVEHAVAVVAGVPVLAKRHLGDLRAAGHMIGAKPDRQLQLHTSLCADAQPCKPATSVGTRQTQSFPLPSPQPSIPALQNAAHCGVDFVHLHKLAAAPTRKHISHERQSGTPPKKIHSPWSRCTSSQTGRHSRARNRSASRRSRCS